MAMKNKEALELAIAAAEELCGKGNKVTLDEIAEQVGIDRAALGYHLTAAKQQNPKLRKAFYDAFSKTDEAEEQEKDGDAEEAEEAETEEEETAEGEMTSIDALASILSCLQPFDPAERISVMRAVVSFFDIGLAAP